MLDSNGRRAAMDGYSKLRRGRVSLPGQVYLVTFTTAFRQPLFVDSATARCACRAMTDQRLWYHSRLLAWVLMPDHWHGLIEIGGMDHLSVVVQRLKANSARRVRAEFPTHARVWEKGFHDRALRHETMLKPAARYLVANPLRAGLAQQFGDYPYWNSVWL